MGDSSDSFIRSLSFPLPSSLLARPSLWATAVAGDPQENVAFYAGVHGMHLVKESVNRGVPDTQRERALRQRIGSIGLQSAPQLDRF